MILRTTVRAAIYPETLRAGCSKAAHAVAVQAERDSRPYIPSATGKLRRSGKVYGRTIVWDTPYARLQYFGKVHVDPVRKIAGFPVAGGWRSFANRKKVRSERNFHHDDGGPQWFQRAKDAHLEEWVKLAQGVIARGK